MGLFGKKSEEQKKAENKIGELCGGFLNNETFKNMLKRNNLDETTSNINYKSVLKNEIKNETLNYDDIERRLDELMKLDVVALDNKIRISHKQDTSIFKTQQDINDFLGEEYTEKYNKSLEKSKAKQMKKAEKEEEKRIKNLEKEEEMRIKNLEKRKSKIKKLEEKFNVDLTEKDWFECSIEEIKYSTFYNEPRRETETAYVVINKDNFEILKESIFIKSNMGTRKIFYDNITSIDYDARGRLHASSSIIINTKSSEHIQLKFVDEKNYRLLNDAFEDYIKKPLETTIVSQSSKADDLLKYAELYEKGLISEEEFNKLKNEVIGGESNPDVNENAESDNEVTKNFCTNCGSKVELDAKFCSSCGNKLD